MKLTITLCSLGLASLLVQPAAGAPRAFRSADGSKEIWGEITDVISSSKGLIVEMVLDGSERRIKFPASTLSEEDQAFIEEQAKLMSAGRDLKLEIEPAEERSDPELTKGRRIVTADSAFNLEFRNDGKHPFDELDVDYQIFYRKAVRKGQLDSERVDKFASGTLKLEKIDPRQEIALKTDQVAIVSDRPNRGGPG